MKKKKNAFVRFFCAIGRGIRTFFLSLIFIIIYIFIWPFFLCKVKGKENVRDDDEARVFLANHYEIFGPMAIYFSFPYKFRPWIIDKMMEPESVEQQMSYMIMSNYKHVPVWLKKFVIHSLKHLMIFIMNVARGISVSREKPRMAIKTFEISTETLEKKEAVVIFPELLYVQEGIGEFQTGFEHFAKYYHKKTNKHVTIYPVFISKELHTMYIGEPTKFDPEENNVDLIKLMHDNTEALYLKHEACNKKLIKKRAKRLAKAEKQRKKLEEKQSKKENVSSPKTDENTNYDDIKTNEKVEESNSSNIDAKPEEIENKKM